VLDRFVHEVWLSQQQHDDGCTLLLRGSSICGMSSGRHDHRIANFVWYLLQRHCSHSTAKLSSGGTVCRYFISITGRPLQPYVITSYPHPSAAQGWYQDLSPLPHHIFFSRYPPLRTRAHLVGYRHRQHFALTYESLSHSEETT
jgi:hypothetical protein